MLLDINSGLIFQWCTATPSTVFPIAFTQTEYVACSTRAILHGWSVPAYGNRTTTTCYFCSYMDGIEHGWGYPALFVGY